MTLKRSKAVTRYIQVQLWAPPAADAVANQDGYGAVNRAAADWTRIGRPYWVSIEYQAASDTPVGRQGSSNQTLAVEIESIADFSLDWRMEFLDGGGYMYPFSVSIKDLRTMVVLCRLARKT